jgi:membrane protease YdiL (CAAX protease family)
MTEAKNRQWASHGIEGKTGHQKNVALVFASVVPLLLPSDVAVVAVLLLLIIAVPAAGALFARRTNTGDPTQGRKHRRYARTIAILWTMTALAAYALRLHRESPADVGVRPPDDPIWYAAALLIVAGILSLSGGGRGDIAPAYARAIRAILPYSTADWIWFVPLAATAAVCEEFLYRGYALTQISALSGNVPAGVALSSLAFGLGHAYQGRIGMVGTALTGLLYAGLFLAGGSLLPCVAAHFLQDVAGAALLSRRLR